MKKLLFLLCLLSINANSENLVSLDSYMAKNGLKDPVARVYVYNRCTALFIMLAVQAKNQKDSESIKFTNNARQAYLTMSMASVNATTEAFKKPEEPLKQNQVIVKKLEGIYQDYADKQMDLGSDLFEDKLIGIDLKICSEIYKTLLSK